MNDEPRGVGGWLTFFLLILGVLTPIFSVFLTWHEISTEPPSNDPKLGTHNALSWGTLALHVAIYWFIVYRLLAARTWQSVRIAVAGLWLGVLLPTLVYCFGYAALYAVPVGEVFEVPFTQYLEGLILNLIWTAYLLK
jgi:hypothetical protein